MFSEVWVIRVLFKSAGCVIVKIRSYSTSGLYNDSYIVSIRVSLAVNDLISKDIQPWIIEWQCIPIDVFNLAFGSIITKRLSFISKGILIVFKFIQYLKKSNV